MSGRIDKIQLVTLTIFGVIVQGYTLCLDGNATLFLDIEAVQNLRFHLSVTETAAELNKAIGQGGFAMIDMGDDGKITDVA